MPVDINGEIISDEKAGVSPFDSGFQYGFGLYETFFVKDSKVAFYPEHISRLKSSLKYFNLEVPYDFFERLRARILLLIHENSISDGRLRMTLTPGIWRLPLFRTEKINSVLNIQPISKQPDSVSLQISRVLKSPVPVFPPFVKITGNYPSILSYREAR
ncbi:MAG: aminotransferase class IV, partial [Leptospira sp.]|nr:aminotransferase class IV [Leptospira sp.]